MRKRLMVSLFVLIFGIGFTAFAAQNENKSGGKFEGVWAGSWTGGSSGKFELTIIRDADGKLSATVVTTPEGGDGGTLKSNTFETADNKAKIKFADPEGNVEVSLEGALDGAAFKGTYSVRDKAQGTEVETGTWTAAMK